MANPSPNNYEGWTREQLIERLTILERPKIPPPSPKSGPPKQFTFASYPRRKIALKFCYSGWEYGGLAFQTKPGPLPTVEGVLFEALSKARLIDPEAGMDACGWEKCGRTDRGVSAAGQVISLWVRSALPLEDLEALGEAQPTSDQALTEAGPSSLIVPPVSDQDESGNEDGLSSLEDGFGSLDLDTSSPIEVVSTPKSSELRYEHNYLSILNRILPPTIRILAWSPVSPNFSARFSCLYRHYKYFFSPQNLDIDRMREAASRLVGEHDFRNLCKLDAQKQITAFRRNVMRADIEPLEDSEAEQGLYVFNLIGSAFLYHQVRHIMAILFLVGSGLEHPSVVSSLLNIEEGLEARREQDPQYEVVDRKPEYQMADALPLMLWECGYPGTELNWRTTGKHTADGDDAITGGDLYQQLESIHRRSQIYTIMDSHFLSAASKHCLPPPPLFPVPQNQLSSLDVALTGHTMNIPLGGGSFKRAQKYTPLLRRNRLDTVEVMNERWRVGKGFRKDERKRAAEEVDDADE